MNNYRNLPRILLKTMLCS
nr:unnamed protein product [Callosobruchus analis]CAI5842536.1 unnamed protein product [Callosobruchus analis]CAI5845304.1 unnamed protein product [Callosobruchus analis]CAI5850280.1 unnamed protein product [Callosobruchus analis]CAI5850739.1 unnamed protein product [Callosobruchus analis]